MTSNGQEWQIVYIPDKPPIFPSQQPTVNVFASLVEPKHANTIIRRLNQIAPLENLRHVKRIQKRIVEGKTQLSVFLCLASENEDPSNNLPRDVLELTTSFQLSPFVTKSIGKRFEFLRQVCKYAATSKEEWEEQCKLWPTSYHPPTYNIEGITGFGEEDLQFIYKFMKLAIDMAKPGDDLVVNAALIVDPSGHKIIASGCDQVHGPPNKIINGKNPDSNGDCTMTFASNDSYYQLDRLNLGVGCLNPWQWSSLQFDMQNSCDWHPLRHAAIVAIQSSSERDRRLFPTSNHPQELTQNVDSSSPAKRQKTDFVDNESTFRPYLCTGYDIYLVWEPCIMCAMALVHQRVRRIFYAYPNRKAGSLGSVYRLQGEKSLNHHYAVFRVFLPRSVMVSNGEKCFVDLCGNELFGLFIEIP